MLHAVPPQNRHIQVMKPSQPVACVFGPTFSPFNPPHLTPSNPTSTQLLLLVLLQSLGGNK